MYMNGVLIGMEVIVAVHRQIRKDLTATLPVSCAVAVGSSMRGSAVCPIVATTIRPAGTAISDSALPLPVSL